MRVGTRISVAVAAAALLLGACNKSTTPQVSSGTQTTAKSDPSKANQKSGGDGGSTGGDKQGGSGSGGDGGSSGGDGNGGGGGGSQDTITVDALVAQFETAAANAGLDADTTKCVTDNMRSSAPSNVLTAQQAMNIQEESVNICAQMNQRIHEMIVGGPTTTF